MHGATMKTVLLHLQCMFKAGKSSMQSNNAYASGSIIYKLDVFKFLDTLQE